MAEIAVSAAAKVAEYLVEYLVAPIARPFIYLWNYKSNVENLKNEVEKLEARRDTVQCLVQVGEEPLPHVKNWQDRADQIIGEALEVVEHNPDQQNMQCCKGFTCPNLMKRHQRSKTAALKLKDVVGLEQEAVNFRQIAYNTIPEQTCLQPSKGHEAFESRNLILKDIIDALGDPDVNMVGIYGMGGVGKTTLAREVAMKAKQDKLFDKIVFVEVSQSLDIQNIQGVIADNLGMQFREETVPGRANRLCDQLKKEEKILLILDNIWGSINFEKVGIPFDNDRKELKLLLTTRSRDLLTNMVNSQRNFHVEALNEVDAWRLFKSIAGTCVEQPHLKSIATQVAKECGGMPVAIVTIAQALRNKEEYVWKKVFGELKNPSSESFRGIAKEVYTSIKLSYDYLENDELKEIFLLCSRMGRTYNASVRDLFRYGCGLGFFDRFDTVEDALCNVYASIHQLKATSLLLDAPRSGASFYYGISPGKERFAIHDVVCDVARSIAFREQNVFNAIDIAIPRYWTNEGTLGNCTSITFHNIVELSEDLQLVCPQLKFLYLKPKKKFSRISDKLFLGMPRLQCLHLIEIDLPLLPTSFSCLVDLQTLCLDECHLGEIAVIGELKKLRILSFRHSRITKLPEEMRQLTKLRTLDLTNCSKLSVIPPYVMSSLTKLEALYMVNTSIEWEVEKPNNERRNTSLDELEHLSDLASLEIQIPNAAMSRGLLSPKLERYKIFIGDKWKGFDDLVVPAKTSRSLKIKVNTNEDGVILISLLRGIRELELDEVPGVENIFNDLDRIRVLEHLIVQNNSHFLHMVDSEQSTSCDVFPILKSLVLKNLINLKKICNGPLGVESFCQLRTIKVEKCNKLFNIFLLATNSVFQELEEIEVLDCENMKEIFSIGGQEDANNTEVVHQIKFNQLGVLHLHNLPQLNSFCCNVMTVAREIISQDNRDISTPLFNEKVMFPKLETLKISNIHVEKIWHNKLPTTSSTCIQNLTHLTIEGCDTLRELFSSSVVNSFVKLQYLNISKCPLLEELVVTEELREERKRDIISFHPLKDLILKDLAKLRILCYGNYIEFPSLKEVKIEGCPELKEFIFDNKISTEDKGDSSNHHLE